MNRIRRGFLGMVECFGPVVAVLILLLCLGLVGVAYVMHGPALAGIELGLVVLAVVAFGDLDRQPETTADDGYWDRCQWTPEERDQLARVPSANAMDLRRNEFSRITSCLGGNHAGREL